LEVVGDPGLLEEVIAQLLDNAVRFTAAGGRIDVRADRRRDAVEMLVRDDGVGIAPEELPHVFGLFRVSRPPGAGLGLGLPLVKSLVEQQGGQVEARSDGSGKGSEFVVRLPAAVRGAPVPEP
jgi:signal transduction histidine kinase